MSFNPIADLDSGPGLRVGGSNEGCACGLMCTAGVLAFPVNKLICWMGNESMQSSETCSQARFTVTAVVSASMLSVLCCIGLAIVCYNHCRPLSSDRVTLLSGGGHNLPTHRPTTML